MSDGFCGTHLQIMVNTRGLGRALGQVTLRGVGRGDHDDSDDAPQRRRPTASARRQRVAVTADHIDEPIIADPDVQDDPMEAPAVVEDIHADAGAEAAEDQPQGFSGGPSDPSVLTAYADHVACSVWTGEERPELKLSSHGRKVHMSPESARAETVQCRGPYVRLQWVREVYQRRCQACHWTNAARAYLLHLLGCTLFANKSATNVHVVYLEALRDLSMTERYAWGVAALVHMYDHLNDASMSHSQQLGGYITLLQCWIYEHFPSVAESTADQDYDEASPRACRWIATKKTVKSIRTPSYMELLDRLRIPDVCWIPYGEHREVRVFHVRSCYSGLLHWGPVAVYNRPERVVRQFGYTQTIPAPPVDSWVSYDDIHDRWMHYEDHIVPAGEVCVVPGACSSDYIDWFFRISHPFMTPGHAVDPLPHGHAPQPRVVPQVSQTDIPRMLEPGASSTSTEEPRHAVEECLRLVRSVTQDHLVYIRCRRRRHTDQA
ncbi:Protein MAIN-LIKE 1 [Glycine max]|nr:Protein MAIN-LIKE 1 [Glycine max]